MRDSLPYYREGIRAGLAQGDFEYTGHLLTLASLSRLHCGVALGELAPEIEQERLKIDSLRQERSSILQHLVCQLVHDLSAEQATAPLSGPFYDERAMLPKCLDPLDHNLTFNHYLMKMIACVLLGDREQALAAAHNARAYFADATFGLYLGAIFVFWDALLSLRANVGLRRAKQARKQLARWADSAPMNYRHKVHLIDAELARTRGQFERAVLAYESAIEQSQTHGYLHETALAQELAAKFYLERGMDRLGRQYLRESSASYRRWGAHAVCARLVREYPQHLTAVAATARTGHASLSMGPLAERDYRALLKSSQAISSELSLPSLLERLLQTMFEHAGAQRALLVLERGGQLYVAAQADVDRGGVELIESEPISSTQRLCRSVVRYVAHSSSPLTLDDASQDPRFSHDDYTRERQPKSVLCVPLIYQARLFGVAYLENNRVSHVFTDARREVASLLAAQAAISIATARFHAVELDAQQAKINPHFLFNALSSIAELSVQDGVRTEQALIKLARLYRYILLNSEEQRVTLAQELEVVASYLALEKLRFGSKLEFAIDCDPSVRDVPVPGLLIQPLVENSIRHGVAPKLSAGNVWVYAVRSGERCRIVVQDDGEGSSSSTSGTGFGLRSVQRRLSLVYGQEHSIAITQRSGYRIEIEIPLRERAPEHALGRVD